MFFVLYGVTSCNRNVQTIHKVFKPVANHYNYIIDQFNLYIYIIGNDKSISYPLYFYFSYFENCWLHSQLPQKWAILKTRWTYKKRDEWSPMFSQTNHFFGSWKNPNFLIILCKLKHTYTHTPPHTHTHPNNNNKADLKPLVSPDFTITWLLTPLLLSSHVTFCPTCKNIKVCAYGDQKSHINQRVNDS